MREGEGGGGERDREEPEQGGALPKTHAVQCASVNTGSHARHKVGEAHGVAQGHVPGQQEPSHWNPRSPMSTGGTTAELPSPPRASVGVSGLASESTYHASWT